MTTVENPGGVQVVIHNHPEQQGRMRRWVVRMVLLVSLLANVVLFASASSYFSHSQVTERFRSGDAAAADKIAVIPIKGMITSEGVQPVIKELRRAADDPAVKGVLLEIDSPGGTLSGSDELYNAVLELKTSTGGSKPVVAFLKGMATSGGYYVAVSADRIIAERSCMTGSIGVIMSHFHGERLLEKIGVTPEVVKSGPMKDSGSMFRPMSESERKEWQKLVDAMYRQFVGVVLKHRGERIGGEEKLLPLADGRVILAEDAVKSKLIDSLGYQSEAIAELKRISGLSEKVRIIDYSRPTFGWSTLMGNSSFPEPAGELRKLADALSPQLLLMPGPNAAYLVGLLEGTNP